MDTDYEYKERVPERFVERELRIVLKYGIYFSILLGGLTFILNRGLYRHLGSIGIALSSHRAIRPTVRHLSYAR